MAMNILTTKATKLHYSIPPRKFLHLQVGCFYLRWGCSNSARTQLQENILGKNYYIDVDIAHLISFDEELAHRLVNEPADVLPLVGLPSIIIEEEG